jgi:hypothetical protein
MNQISRRDEKNYLDIGMYLSSTSLLRFRSAQHILLVFFADIFECIASIMIKVFLSYYLGKWVASSENSHDVTAP